MSLATIAPAPAPPLTLKQLATLKAALTRHHGATGPRTLEVAAALRYALLEQAIRQALATAPPMSEADRKELALLLLGRQPDRIATS